MVAPEINYKVQCCHCGTVNTSETTNAKCANTYFYKPARQKYDIEVVLSQCTHCKKQLIISITSDGICYPLKKNSKLSFCMH